MRMLMLQSTAVPCWTMHKFWCIFINTSMLIRIPVLLCSYECLYVLCWYVFKEEIYFSLQVWEKLLNNNARYLYGFWHQDKSPIEKWKTSLVKVRVWYVNLKRELIQFIFDFFKFPSSSSSSLGWETEFIDRNTFYCKFFLFTAPCCGWQCHHNIFCVLFVLEGNKINELYRDLFFYFVIEEKF